MQWRSRKILYSFHNNQTHILLELYIILLLFITFIFDYLPLKPLAYNQELVYYCFVCLSIQFPFALFQQDSLSLPEQSL